MEVIKLYNIFKYLIILNLLYFVKTSTLNFNNQEYFQEEESSGILDTDLIPIQNSLNSITNYEQNVGSMEEKLISLTENLNQLELKMCSLASDNMDFFEKNVRQMMEKLFEEKLKSIHQIVEEKMEFIEANKVSYTVQDIKCPDNRLPKSCYDLNVCSNNIYSLMLPEISNNSFAAVCDLKTLDGGWTIIQRRKDGSENFFRNWTDYVKGFGDLNREFFIGLEKLHALTSQEDEPQELYIILEDFEGERRYAKYGKFKVDSKSSDYNLTVSDYNGNAGDCLTQHNGRKFSTYDRDNDTNSTKNCAKYWKGAWWYSNCFASNLNGMYLAGKTPDSVKGVAWCGFRNFGYSLKFVQMMIRPKTT